MMLCPRHRRLIAALVFCMLLLQNCRPRLHAITEDPAPEGYRGAGSAVQADGQALAPRPVIWTLGSYAEPSDIRHRMLAKRRPTTSSASLPASATVHPVGAFCIPEPLSLAASMHHAQFVSRPFTAASGERVSFSKKGDRWQAILQHGTGSCAYERTLPVVSAENIGALLKDLQRQDIWASRSRIHIMATTHPAYAPCCVYLGKCGLLGGMPVRRALFPMFESAYLATDPTPNAQAAGSTEEALVSLLPSHTPIPPQAFGAARWKQYFGDVGTAPPLPNNISKILNSSCPFWPGQQVKDTHLLVLIPSTINGRPFTLNLLNELIQNPRSGACSTKFDYYDGEIARVFGDQPSGSSHWVLMTRDVLPGSKTGAYTFQQALIAEYAYSNGVPYEMPHALEAATSILMHFACTGDRLYTDDPWTYTRCQERLDVDDEKCSLFVGGFASGGLDLDYEDGVHDFGDGDGVSCLRNFMQEERLRQNPIPPQAFGAEAWGRYFGEVGAAPPLPANIHQILDHACPFWPDKTVKDTHLLVLIPLTVDGELFTLTLLEKLIRSTERGGYSTDFCLRNYVIRRLLGGRAPRSAHWVLMTKDVLPNSRMQTYEVQRELVASYAQNRQLHYDMPYMLETATAILLHYVCTGERLYAGTHGTYTRCKEQIVYESEDHPVVVGDFSSEGLDIDLNHYTDFSNCYGVSCLRRF